ncbi:MAG: FMN-binding negative transcriptional regulator [Bacteroidia bacterium]|nr:FMN-binding negative transcriptional regulator [Bacteroidia bacterium]NNF30612.1 FMN-binding negative transcriptional regulator [Flavobacteriaceae bacterium]MBT8276279.1 FMN-binding negative transcriptional regulator [Bacteroidia bacterium]NNJ80913.1 FMN-binding negative transcriptional regulator [Flavobacteriaceae bacterium]NNK53172.1 FMN-binding negative transcriptional regulator [Flavobacteriaceae bacterium]
MYPPPHHQTNDRRKMIAVMKAFPFALLVTASKDHPYITHIPIIYNETSGRLVAHIDATNPQVETLNDGNAATVVFKGPDTYISPSVYSTEQLPTWNYIIVHITGVIHRITDPKAVKKTMIDMTDFLEGNDPKFVLKKDNPKMDRMVNYIKAFEIEITNWEGKFKLSQDKIPQDYELAKEALIQNTQRDYKEFINSIYKNL